MTPTSPTSSVSAPDPNITALIERAADKAREIPRYSFDEENETPPTNPEIHVTVNLPREPSNQEIQVEMQNSDPPAKKQLKMGMAQAATLVGLAAVTAIVGLLQNCGHH